MNESNRSSSSNSSDNDDGLTPISPRNGSSRNPLDQQDVHDQHLRRSPPPKRSISSSNAVYKKSRFTGSTARPSLSRSKSGDYGMMIQRRVDHLRLQSTDPLKVMNGDTFGTASAETHHQSISRSNSDASLDFMELQQPRRSGGRKKLHRPQAMGHLPKRIASFRRSLSNNSSVGSGSGSSTNLSIMSLTPTNSFRESKVSITMSNNNFRRRRSPSCLAIYMMVSMCAFGFLAKSYFAVERSSGKIKIDSQNGTVNLKHDVLLKSVQSLESIATTSVENDAIDKENANIKKIGPSSTTGRFSYVDNTKRLKLYQEQHGESSVRKLISAFTEPPMLDTVPGTGGRHDEPSGKEKGFGQVPEFVVPLPRRTTTPDDLQMHVYPASQTCFDLPAKFPVDRGLQFDSLTKQPIVWNIGNEATPPDFPQTQAKYCPVEMDPFLPWIHDVVVSPSGRTIDFVAQNMRRCRTGKAHTENVNRLVPQVTLMQAVSVQRINESMARQLAPDMWQRNTSTILSDVASVADASRYRLVPHEDASEDGKETRFICRFHTSIVNKNGTLSSLFVGETLSVFPFNYEMISYRKSMRSMLSPSGTDAGLFWASTLHFQCPVPDDDNLHHAIASGRTILPDGTPTLHVDIVPIRTSARYEEIYLTTEQIAPDPEAKFFDPLRRWGPNNVLPDVEASGRWSNIPICYPPTPHLDKNQQRARNLTDSASDESQPNASATNKINPDVGGLRHVLPDNKTVSSKRRPPHVLSACLWASAEFNTRGESKLKNTETIQRLQEWIEFHLLVGFDHIYVYDNTGAHTNQSSLLQITNQYPSTQVTWIDWPSTVCNNNRPSEDSAGERSSQYAAEASCRVRYGQYTEWLASFDTDEYFVPMGNYTNLQDVLSDMYQMGGTKIVSFKSSRGKLRADKSEVVRNGTALIRAPNATFMEAYNCDGTGSPKPSWAVRAKKQIYRTDYVLHHFVHYSTATRGIVTTYKEHQQQQQASNYKRSWQKRYIEYAPTEMFTNELTQAVMLHAKSIYADVTQRYRTRCRYDFHTKKAGQECWVATPWPTQNSGNINTHNSSISKATENEYNGSYDVDSGMRYNCYINLRIEEYWIPRLREALMRRSRQPQRQFTDV